MTGLWFLVKSAQLRRFANQYLINTAQEGENDSGLTRDRPVIRGRKSRIRGARQGLIHILVVLGVSLEKSD